jgi:type II secretory pathway component PulJ
MKNKETSSQEQDIEKMKTFKSQQKRDLRRVTIRKAECASSKARENFEQQSEQKRQQGIATIANRANVATFNVVQI